MLPEPPITKVNDPLLPVSNCALLTHRLSEEELVIAPTVVLVVRNEPGQAFACIQLPDISTSEARTNMERD